MGVSVTGKAVDPKQGMSLAELRNFVENAIGILEMGGESKVKAVVGFHGQIKSLEIEGRV